MYEILDMDIGGEGLDGSYGNSSKTEAISNRIIASIALLNLNVAKKATKARTKF